MQAPSRPCPAEWTSYLDPQGDGAELLLFGGTLGKSREPSGWMEKGKEQHQGAFCDVPQLRLILQQHENKELRAVRRSLCRCANREVWQSEWHSDTAYELTIPLFDKAGAGAGAVQIL